MRIRTEYSTNFVYGKLSNVFKHLLSLECEYMPISDRYSTFGFVEWNELCEKNNKNPIFGVELGVSNNSTEKNPSISYFTFFAINDVKVVNDLVALATSQPGALLTYEQANSQTGAIVIADNRVNLSLCNPESIYISLCASTPIGLYNKSKELGFRFIQTSDNTFPKSADVDTYRVLLGRFSDNATYPKHIETSAEWDNSVRWFDEQDRIDAINNRTILEHRCSARLVKAKLPKIDAPVSLADLCLEGAARLGLTLDEIYTDRLAHEIAVIQSKGFEDYFYIVADLMQWARQRMIVAPGRGSSAGSLVCYLLGITSVDPLKYNLLFERFLDVTRADLPDIDMDFDDEKRDMVFDYLENKYGSQHFAKIANVNRFRAKTIVNRAAASLKIPIWMSQKAAEELFEVSSVDERALTSFEASFQLGEMSRKMVREYPAISLVFDSEFHASHMSVHAAGAVITDGVIAEYVAIDRRNNTVMADKNVAEKIGLLKLDILSLSQLSTFARTLELLGVDATNAWLEQIPLDDPEAFAIINNKKYAGISQMGRALISLFKQFHVNKLEDIVAVTSLARPGPLMSGAAQRWVNRRLGVANIKYAHECLEPYLNTTYGELVYQEQLMQIASSIGGMSIEDVSALRKAVAKSKGAEALRPFGDKFKLGAARFGFVGSTVDEFWNDLCGFGAYSFNRCISGETYIERDAANRHCSKHETIETLYRLQEERRSNKRQNSGWRNKNIKLISLFEDRGRGFSNEAINIIKNGERECSRYIFDDGSEVVCTKEHRFLINNNWAEIQSAQFGDNFSCLRANTQDEINKRNYISKDELGKGHAKNKSWGDITDNDRSGPNNVSYKTGIRMYFDQFKKEHQFDACEDCGALNVAMEIHHGDFNEGQGDPKDLYVLCVSCHKKRHYSQGRTKRGDIGRVVYYKKLVSVEYVGLRETYDIEMKNHHNYQLSNGLITHNSHAVSYSIITYYCCWLKAFYPIEFAAATLDAEKDPTNQITLLRELHSEGISYIPVDAAISTDRWAIKVTVDDNGDKTKALVGPLTAVKGIGPAALKQILEARQTGKALPPGLQSKLDNAITPIDSLTPVATAVARCIPDLTAVKITSKPVPIASLDKGDRGTFMIIGLLTGIKKKDRNDAESLMRRDGRRINGNSLALNLTFKDDSGADILAIVDTSDYKDAAPAILERGGIDKAIYAVKGTIPANFRMLSIEGIRYLCNIDDGLVPITDDLFGPQTVVEDLFAVPKDSNNDVQQELQKSSGSEDENQSGQT